jgi:sec-independent protein translocase protein TatA
MFEGLFQPMHLVLVLVIAIVVFGPRRLPELGKALGESISGLKKGLRDATDSDEVSSERR